ncbi:MAG: S-methyl-5-thioribose-1-phosphate isomerase [Rhodanobacteraceae bacterium]|mgnify:FL=1|nr:S-methyl-5-thioribose-1-phosphate isomerase [Rhodanobacteraceae bacterium]MBL0041989.1 S-methyl-5-thioribose-1-phosphate isomerase [Xanthomonadales bacterium]MBP6077750.1 S-methyl-5-thioribose-1-phosphate isomerase [Xanthomonadales bacterium]
MMIDYDRYDRIRAVQWQGEALRLLDQRVLPLRTEFVTCATADEVATAIRNLTVRGAPAIGIAAAYGVALAARSLADRSTGRVHAAALREAFAVLRASRPTAVNLFWALDRMARVLGDSVSADVLESEAIAIEREDLAANRHMGELGAGLIAPGSGVLTHCNTGSLATAGFGTALGVIRAAYAQGRLSRVFNTETRPWLQGTRLTAWELLTDGIPAKLIADAAAAHLMSTGAVQWVIVGADRIAANGDTANKIGTLQLAVAARHFGAKFMVVAPSSTVDMAMPHGGDIHIELREPRELLEHAGQRVAAEGVDAWNPVFDVVPAVLIDALVTERGVIETPDAAKMLQMFGNA